MRKAKRDSRGRKSRVIESERDRFVVVSAAHGRCVRSRMRTIAAELLQFRFDVWKIISALWWRNFLFCTTKSSLRALPKFWESQSFFLEFRETKLNWSDPNDFAICCSFESEPSRNRASLFTFQLLHFAKLAVDFRDSLFLGNFRNLFLSTAGDINFHLCHSSSKRLMHHLEPERTMNATEFWANE